MTFSVLRLVPSTFLDPNAWVVAVRVSPLNSVPAVSTGVPVELTVPS